MPIKILKINQFRNIKESSLEFHPKLNFLIGENGAGKSSLLEAINFTLVGRSHRTRKVMNVINFDSTQFDLFAEVLSPTSESTRIGIHRGKLGSITKINGEQASKISDLAKLLPIKLLNNQSFQFLEGGSLERRQFIDWLVFHVKHDYGDLWNQGVRCIKQRNKLLKSNSADKYVELDLWDKQLEFINTQITDIRNTTFRAFKNLFYSFISEQITEFESVKIDYFSGWNEDISFSKLLKSQRETDIRYGYTSVGFHKADIKCTSGSNRVVDVFSRGQQKRLLIALFFCQLFFLSQRETAEHSLLLIDDFSSELDLTNRKLIADLIGLVPNIQLIITGIDWKEVIDSWHSSHMQHNDFYVFHVKHGTITRQAPIVE